jgi:hypothetical protein
MSQVNYCRVCVNLPFSLPEQRTTFLSAVTKNHVLKSHFDSIMPAASTWAIEQRTTNDDKKCYKIKDDYHAFLLNERFG